MAGRRAGELSLESSAPTRLNGKNVLLAEHGVDDCATLRDRERCRQLLTGCLGDVCWCLASPQIVPHCLRCPAVLRGEHPKDDRREDPAELAAAWGLIWEAVDDEALADRAQAIARQLAWVRDPGVPPGTSSTVAPPRR